MKPKAFYSTSLGHAYQGRCEEVLAGLKSRYEKRVQLIFTSPPFALNRKKKYGNLKGQQYVDWLASFADLFSQMLTEDGSIVLELGNGWDEGRPTMSTLPLEALLEFKRRGDFFLCQEFVCFNPARLPSPAQWVNVDRCRVKDAFTRIWWLSRSPRPKADNRKVLTEYSASMRKLLERGTYNAGHRPSEYNIGKKSFLTDNMGAIPPSVLAPPIAEVVSEIMREPCNVFSLTNTHNHDAYQDYCRRKKLVLHPARMPAKLVEFFVNFLTDIRDLVVDPFAGSNTTGAVAESLGRRWISIEVNSEYLPWIGFSGWRDARIRLTAFETTFGEKIEWKPFNDSESNDGPMSLNAYPGRAFIERVTNEGDAVLEAKAATKNGGLPKSPADAVELWYGLGPGVLASKLSNSDVLALAKNTVTVTGFIGDSKDPKDSIFDARDFGIGLTAADMPGTILSLNRGNKKSKAYLTGKHGQGASSTYQYADLTLIASGRKKRPTSPLLSSRQPGTTSQRPPRTDILR